MNATTAVMVLALHGGGFTGGGPADVRPVVEELHRQGIQAKAPRYPLGRGLGAAYRGALRQVRRYQRRGYRVVVYGHSAGASMALWLAATHRVPAVAMNPVTDFPGWRLGPLPLPEWQARKAHSLGTMTVQLRLSPINSLTPTSGRATILHSVNDSIVPYRQSSRYVRRSRRLGVRTQLVTTHTDHHQDVRRAVASVRRVAIRTR